MVRKKSSKLISSSLKENMTIRLLQLERLGEKQNLPLIQHKRRSERSSEKGDERLARKNKGVPEDGEDHHTHQDPVAGFQTLHGLQVMTMMISSPHPRPSVSIMIHDQVEVGGSYLFFSKLV